MCVLASCTVATRVSVSSNDVQGNGDSGGPALSNGGRYVAFSSVASNLVPNDTNGQSDAFVRDTVRHTTTRVSVTNAGGQITGGWSGASAISDDGRYVLFTSGDYAVTGENGPTQVFLRDRTAGTTTLVSRRADGTLLNGGNSARALSPDGRFALFTSLPLSNPPEDASTEARLFRFDRTNGTVTLLAKSHACERQPSSFQPAIGEADEAWNTGAFAFVDICNEGENTWNSLIVALPSQAPVLLANVGGHADMTLDWATDGSLLAWTEHTASSRSGEELGELKTWTGSGQPQVVDTPGGAFDVAVNGSGRYLAYTTTDRRVDEDLGFQYKGLARVTVLDRQTGERQVASTNLDGRTPDGDPDFFGVVGSHQPALDERGTTVGFQSSLSDIVIGDTNGFADVFTRPVSSVVGSERATAARVSG
jgi:Tol biopolymer transport system component